MTDMKWVDGPNPFFYLPNSDRCHVIQVRNCHTRIFFITFPSSDPYLLYCYWHNTSPKLLLQFLTIFIIQGVEDKTIAANVVWGIVHLILGAGIILFNFLSLVGLYKTTTKDQDIFRYLGWFLQVWSFKCFSYSQTITGKNPVQKLCSASPEPLTLFLCSDQWYTLTSVF